MVARRLTVSERLVSHNVGERVNAESSLLKKENPRRR